MHDLVIRGGTVVDGTGAPSRTADVAVDDGIITAVGELESTSAHRTIDADGLLVTPGVVDVHTHYDGQVTWDPLVTPSSWHGVTTIVISHHAATLAACQDAVVIDDGSIVETGPWAALQATRNLALTDGPGA